LRPLFEDFLQKTDIQGRLITLSSTARLWEDVLPQLIAVKELMFVFFKKPMGNKQAPELLF
jgi:hypothetical protein